MKVIYIAGPFRGKDSWEVEQNVRRAESIALELWKLGFAVICPHANTRFFQGAAPDGTWLKGDIEIMLRCDAVYTTGLWEQSEGAKVEVDVAEQNGIPVFSTYYDLKRWANHDKYRARKRT